MPRFRVEIKDANDTDQRVSYVCEGDTVEEVLADVQDSLASLEYWNGRPQSSRMREALRQNGIAEDVIDRCLQHVMRDPPRPKTAVEERNDERYMRAVMRPTETLPRINGK